MKFWTTQTEEVIKYILDNKVYKPDFSLSNGLGSNQMKVAYHGTLEEYKFRNNLDCNGLVFGVSQLEDRPVENIEQYKNYFKANKMFWDSVSHAGENYAILELEIPNEIDVIPLYFQDFIILGIRGIKSLKFRDYVKPKLICEDFHHFKEDLRIAQDIGWTNNVEDIFGEPMLYKITQVHIHQILINYVIEVHTTFDFDNDIEYQLGENATKLKDIIHGII